MQVKTIIVVSSQGTYLKSVKPFKFGFAKPEGNGERRG